MRPYSGEYTTYTFKALIENFFLKYSKDDWEEAEIRSPAAIEVSRQSRNPL